MSNQPPLLRQDGQLLVQQVQVHILHRASGVSAGPSTPRERHKAGQGQKRRRPGWLLQENSPNSHPMTLFSLFLFEIFLLLKPATPYEGLASHIAQHSKQTGNYLGQGPPTPKSPQLASAVSVGTQRPCVFVTSSLFPPCDFKQQGLSPCCSNLVWQGREPLTRFSPKNPAADLAGAGPGAAAHCICLLPLLYIN